VNTETLKLACCSGNVEAVHLLLAKAGVEANTLDKRGNAPLHYACGEGRKTVVDALLGVPGIDLNIVNSLGSTPLHYALHNYNDDNSNLDVEGQDFEAVVRVLLASKADVEKVDGDGVSPFAIATRHVVAHLVPDDIIQQLNVEQIEAGVTLWHTLADAETETFLRELSEDRSEDRSQASLDQTSVESPVANGSTVQWVNAPKEKPLSESISDFTEDITSQMPWAVMRFPSPSEYKAASSDLKSSLKMQRSTPLASSTQPILVADANTPPTATDDISPTATDNMIEVELKGPAPEHPVITCPSESENVLEPPPAMQPESFARDRSCVLCGLGLW